MKKLFLLLTLFIKPSFGSEITSFDDKTGLISMSKSLVEFHFDVIKVENKKLTLQYKNYIYVTSEGVIIINTFRFNEPLQNLKLHEVVTHTVTIDEPLQEAKK